jgi:hypothetical protein
MKQIRWIFSSKSPSSLSPWPLWGHFNQIAKTKEKTTINNGETCWDDIYNTIASNSVVSFMVGCWLRPLWPSPWPSPCATIVILLFE